MCGGECLSTGPEWRVKYEVGVGWGDGMTGYEDRANRPDL